MKALRERYKEEVVKKLIDEFGYKNVYQAPRLEKIVVNMGFGEAIQNIKALDSSIADLTSITGQKPFVTKAKKSIAGFKLRKGMSIGCKVTLRKKRMYDFLEKLINIALPRIRDFKGISSNSFDGHGNYNLGIKEQVIFPEINFDKIDKIRGMDICIVTTAKSDEESKALLKLLGMPFKD